MKGVEKKLQHSMNIVFHIISRKKHANNFASPAVHREGEVKKTES